MLQIKLGKQKINVYVIFIFFKNIVVLFYPIFVIATTATPLKTLVLQTFFTTFCIRLDLSYQTT